VIVSPIIAGGAGLLAYGVRGRSSKIFGPSIWRGDRRRTAVALTFDDGPSESTPALIEILREFGAVATFFQCGSNVRRLSDAAREVQASGHEIGNHSDSHPLCCFRSAGFIQDEFARAQQTFQDTLGTSPSLMRAPFGVRWFGYRSMQERLRLLGVMWTVIGLDWKLSPAAICERVVQAASNGAIICLHDGRGCQAKPDMRTSLEAVRRILPALSERGLKFETVSQIICPVT
jgi:peptidoglycan/xylan/chitin deacetylase (PgdA/CDA1 family)